MQDFFDKIRHNIIIQAITFFVIFIFYVYVVNALANFYNIDHSAYANYMFFYAVLLLLYNVLPSSDRNFLN